MVPQESTTQVLLAAGEEGPAVAGSRSAHGPRRAIQLLAWRPCPTWGQLSIGLPSWSRCCPRANWPLRDVLAVRRAGVEEAGDKEESNVYTCIVLDVALCLFAATVRLGLLRS